MVVQHRGHGRIAVPGATHRSALRSGPFHPDGDPNAISCRMRSIPSNFGSTRNIPFRLLQYSSSWVMGWRHPYIRCVQGLLIPSVLLPANRLSVACILKRTRKPYFLPNITQSLQVCIDKICASILGNEWSPVLSVIAVCVTLQSMLASCKVCNISY